MVRIVFEVRCDDCGACIASDPNGIQARKKARKRGAWVDVQDVVCGKCQEAHGVEEFAQSR